MYFLRACRVPAHDAYQQYSLFWSAEVIVYIMTTCDVAREFIVCVCRGGEGLLNFFEADIGLPTSLLIWPLQTSHKHIYLQDSTNIFIYMHALTTAAIQ